MFNPVHQRLKSVEAQVQSLADLHEGIIHLTMYVQRPPLRRSRIPYYLACGCGAVALGTMLVIGLVLFLLLPALPGLALRFSGFEPQGSTQQVFASVPPAPTVQVINPVTPPEVVVNLGELGSQTVAPQTRDYTITVGTSTTGGQVATISFTEASLLNMCLQRSDVCSTTNPQYRNVQFDLRPGGGVVYADVFVPDFGIWQAAGVVLTLDSSRRQFEVAGVDVSGTLYSLPPSGMADTVMQIATTANDLLRQMTLEASGGQYTLSEVIIGETDLMLVLR